MNNLNDVKKFAKNVLCNSNNIKLKREKLKYYEKALIELKNLNIEEIEKIEKDNILFVKCDFVKKVRDELEKFKEFEEFEDIMVKIEGCLTK